MAPLQDCNAVPKGCVCSKEKVLGHYISLSVVRGKHFYIITAMPEAPCKIWWLLDRNCLLFPSVLFVCLVTLKTACAHASVHKICLG